MKKSLSVKISALFFTFLVPTLGYISFGPWPALLFLIGYLGGFLLWLTFPTLAPFSSIKSIYWLTVFLFFLHRVEEKVFGFFDKLAEITQMKKPEILSFPIIALVLLSVGVWIVGPIFYARGNEFGHYLVWTFFASMGLTELAHFVLPFFISEPYGYFPGMATVLLLAPVSWIGMKKLQHSKQSF